MRLDTFGGVLAIGICGMFALYFVATVLVPIGKWVFGASL